MANQGRSKQVAVRNNSFYLRKVLIYMISLSPLPKENLLHCDIVGCLDVISVGFYFLV